MKSLRVAPTASLAVLLLAGCADPAPTSAAPAASSTAATPSRAVGPAPELFRLAGLRPAPAQRETVIRTVQVSTPPSGDYGWSIDRLDPTSTELVIGWTDSPDEACGRANLVQVYETPEAVVIGVQDTTDRPPIDCFAAGLGHVTTVRLQSPTGIRALVVPVQESDITGTTAEFRATLITDPEQLPQPSCDVTGTPVGMPDAATVLAPANPTAVTVCRFSSGDTGTRISRISITDPNRAAALAAQINDTTDALAPTTADYGCDDIERTRHALTFSGRALLAPVSTDSPRCGRVSNGVAGTRTTPELTRLLADLFRENTP